MSILHLSNDLFGSIQEYTDINYLLNTTTNLFYVKYELYYWNLNKKYSLKYYNYIKFRNIVNSKICKTLDQLSLDLSHYYKIEDVSALGNVHTLHLSLCRNLVDVSALGNVHTLYLSGCYKIKDVSAL